MYIVISDFNVSYTGLRSFFRMFINCIPSVHHINKTEMYNPTKNKCQQPKSTVNISLSHSKLNEHPFSLHNITYFIIRQCYARNAFQIFYCMPANRFWNTWSTKVPWRYPLLSNGGWLPFRLNQIEHCFYRQLHSFFQLFFPILLFFPTVFYFFKIMGRRPSVWFKFNNISILFLFLFIFLFNLLF